MKLDQYIEVMLPKIEQSLRDVIDRNVAPETPELRSMLAYHLGWEGEGAGINAQGKRIRPLLVLLSAACASETWQPALPAAAAVELVHNFSLIHDDIQDRSEKRRGRPTVWVKWGIAQAINAGDLMFTLAFYALHDLAGETQQPVALEASRILQEACIHLTRGQYLDLSFENRQVIDIEDYWPMVGGKTAALLSAAAELGALVAGAGEERRIHFRSLGYFLGLAFQAWDDWLGLWGDPLITGKSNQSDLVAGKKTLPVLFALKHDLAFRQRWLKGCVQPDEVPEIAQMLTACGAKEYTEKEANRLSIEAGKALEKAGQNNEATFALRELTDRLLQRKH